MLTQEEVQLLLHYDHVTGVSTWLNRPSERPEWNTRYAGKQAGSLRPDGYRKVAIFHKSYLHSHLVWLYMTGEWPPIKVDHENCTPSDDRWDNLRLATNRQNRANSKISRRNKTGFKGIWFHKAKGRYTAQCIRRHLGLFDSAEEAHAAYLAAAQEQFGDFARGA